MGIRWKARAKQLEQALIDARTWHEEEDKAISKQPATHGPSGNQWARLRHQEQIGLITEAIKFPPYSKAKTNYPLASGGDVEYDNCIDGSTEGRALAPQTIFRGIGCGRGS